VLYAKVVLGLPLEGPFDYSVTASAEREMKIGSRVWVNFRNKKEVAYIVGLSNKTKIKKVKEIISLIDQQPLLDEPLLLLTKRLAQYYCCFWGEAIEAALPDELRKGKEIKQEQLPGLEQKAQTTRQLIYSEEEPPVFVQGFDRIPVYLNKVKEVLTVGKSAIILCASLAAVERMSKIIRENLDVQPFIVFRKQPKELEVWAKIRRTDCCLVVGLRSGIFSPVNNLGLIIIDEPQEQVYKQEQSPHYHARQVGLMRSLTQGVKLILGSHSLSLEDFYLLQKGQLSLEVIPPKSTYPLVKLIDLRRLPYAQRKSKPIFSKFLLDSIQLTLEEKGKVLVVVNRKGFATMAACHSCGKSLKCPRCNINLVFHFDSHQLKCHHCNFKMPVPEICPHCQAGYIKYFGLGAEQVESELARIFPTARLGQDILVATGAVINQTEQSFDLIGVLGIDDLLNRIDFRAAEKAFFMLTGIINLTSKKVIIQSLNQNHHCFQALIKNDPRIFLKEELKTRKQLNFSPFKHMIMLRLRGRDLDKVKAAAGNLFQRLNKIKTNSLKLLWLNPGQPPKLRENYYYQILMRASSVEKAGNFLKLHLKDEHFSGIITTVDVDPV
jgi:primosomal protein N' (replication factor Y) (superfamily II helicase)